MSLMTSTKVLEFTRALSKREVRPSGPAALHDGLGLGLESVGVKQEVNCLMNALVIDNSRLL